jgi:hypothetical protein
MSFVLFLLATATLFLRPGELMPGLKELPIYESLMVGSFVTGLPRICEQLRLRNLRVQPITICVVGLLIASVMSHMSQALLEDAHAAGVKFLKTALYYLLLVSLVDTPARLRTYLLTVVLCATAMVAICAADYLHIVDFEHITHYSEREGRTITGEDKFILRMRGTGIFGDPNDISLVIVATGVLSTYFLLEKAKGTSRILWLAPLSLMMLALLLTRSRGGLLAAGVAALTMATCRYGRRAAILVGVVGMVAVSAIAGRQAEFNLSEGTGQERIQLWSAGLTELMTARLLFGIGMDEYIKLVGYVAHNSFVHAFVELGYFGGTLFFGAFFFAVLALYRMSRLNAIRNPHSELGRLHPYLAGMLAGWSTGLLTLSRCYVVPTYIVLGTIAVFINLSRNRLNKGRSVIVWNQENVLRLLGGSGAMLGGLLIFVRMFARF